MSGRLSKSTIQIIPHSEPRSEDSRERKFESLRKDTDDKGDEKRSSGKAYVVNPRESGKDNARDGRRSFEKKTHEDERRKCARCGRTGHTTRECYAKSTLDGVTLEGCYECGGSSRAATASQDKGTLRFRQSNLEDYVVACDSLEGLSRIGEKKTSAAGSNSSGSTGSRIPEAGMTPSSITLDEKEEEEEHEEEAAAKLVSRKRSREEAAAGAKAAEKNVGSALKKTPEKTKGVEWKDPKEPVPKKTEFIILPPKTTEREVEKPTGGLTLEKEKPKQTETAAVTERVTAQGPKVMRIIGLDQPFNEKEK
ncbi:uncharacterized protein DDB_G0286299-like [Helianthus annuus]|uniref:uncharacterized protein DDB_G0286299-like n=1 Tax=Helianthus annuus TaxID=4232 RepID=UPI000B8FE570|nr:uncharacterized protein DDB_G0286299-like [Helianthus annuus]